MLTSPVTMPRNRILSSLPLAEFKKIQPELKSIKVSHGDVVYQPNEPIKFVYFPENCIISTVTVFDDGTSIENGTIGNEGLLGAAPALSTMTTPREATVQSDGECLRIPTEKFRQAFDQNDTLRQLALSYIFAFFEQVAQAGACNKHHTVNERIARWLLTLHDRSDSDSLQVTQDSMAQMLGVHRPGITLAAIHLKSAGFINYRRGSVQILDRRGLEQASCECYRLIKKAYEQYVSILELQALNRKLETANEKFAVEMENRRKIRDVTQQRVGHLRSVVAEVSKARKSELICARCEQVSYEGEIWFESNAASRENIRKYGSQKVICSDCEDFSKAKTQTAISKKQSSNGRGK